MPDRRLYLNGCQLFSVLFILWLVFLGAVFFEWPKADSFLWVNHQRSALADFLFAAITELGNGCVILCLAATLAWRRQFQAAMGLTVSFSLSAVATCILKQWFHAPRPGAWFKDTSLVETTVWVHVHHANSFPSGHTTTAFAAAMTIAIYFYHRRGIAALAFLLAALVAYSRVYLGQHFVEDTWAGSLVGFLFAVLSYQLIFRLELAVHRAKLKRRIQQMATGMTTNSAESLT